MSSADGPPGAPESVSPRWLALCDELRAEFPRFRVIPKDESPLMAALARGLAMRFWNPRFLSEYTTVLGQRVYMPRDRIGTVRGYRTLRHERVHMRDAARVGLVPFALSYLLLLPSVLTLRAHWEWRAYEETLRAELEDTGAIADETLDLILRRFTGPEYLFMCPFPRRVRARLLALRESLMRQAHGSTGAEARGPSR